MVDLRLAAGLNVFKNIIIRAQKSLKEAVLATFGGRKRRRVRREDVQCPGCKLKLSLQVSG